MSQSSSFDGKTVYTGPAYLDFPTKRIVIEQVVEFTVIKDIESREVLRLLRDNGLENTMLITLM